MSSPAARFAPSPTSELHVGNLRTAVVAWIVARQTGRKFLIRIEDLDQIRVTAAPHVAQQQLRDLAALGITWDAEPVVQSTRLERYAALARYLPTYECFCTRREIAESAQAPHDDPTLRLYPGTCRKLTPQEREAKRAQRSPALRVDAQDAQQCVTDMWAGQVCAPVDDFVVRRNDGAWAYNLAVVIDDAESGVDQVCRGDDLLTSAPRQAWLAEQLGFRAPEYAHVGLAINTAGKRLAKRDGAVTLRQLAAVGVTPEQVRSRIGASLGTNELDEPITMDQLVERFDRAIKPPTWVVGD